jgi:hypothetical protein
LARTWRGAGDADDNNMEVKSVETGGASASKVAAKIDMTLEDVVKTGVYLGSVQPGPLLLPGRDQREARGTA